MRSGPSILIAAAKWWHLSARLALVLRDEGCRVSALCPRGHPLSKVAGLQAVHRYGPIDSLPSLAKAIVAADIDMIIPCDDAVVAQLHALHTYMPQLRPVLEQSLGPSDSFPAVTSRYQLLSLATELGIATAHTQRLDSAEDVARWYRDIGPACVVKSDGESGGNGVRICGSLQGALAAWNELSAPLSLATTIKRVAVDRDVTALWRRKHLRQLQITGQKMIAGSPANCMAAAQNGKLISVLSVAVLTTDGPTGAAVIIRRIRDEQMAFAARRIAAHLKLSGFFGLDFIIDRATGDPVLIEMNPRATQLGHLEFWDQVSLASAFVAAWRDAAAPAPRCPIPTDTVALFPQALKISRGYQRAFSYLDAPRGEPDLHAELQREPWPHRRWAARIYHKLRPIQETTLLDHEPPPISRAIRKSATYNEQGAVLRSP